VQLGEDGEWHAPTVGRFQQDLRQQVKLAMIVVGIADAYPD